MHVCNLNNLVVNYTRSIYIYIYLSIPLATVKARNCPWLLISQVWSNINFASATGNWTPWSNICGAKVVATVGSLSVLSTASPCWWSWIITLHHSFNLDIIHPSPSWIGSACIGVMFTPYKSLKCCYTCKQDTISIARACPRNLRQPIKNSSISTAPPRCLVDCAGRLDIENIVCLRVPLCMITHWNMYIYKYIYTKLYWLFTKTSESDPTKTGNTQSNS